MPNASGPEIPPSTASTSPMTLNGANNSNFCERESVEAYLVWKEVAEERNQNRSQNDFPDIPLTHLEKDERPKLVQKSEESNHVYS